MSEEIKPNYTYFKGTVMSVSEPKSYTDKTTNEQKQLWSVVINCEDGTSRTGAIFEPAKHKKTPETMQELVNTQITGSFYLDESGKEHVFLFGPREPKKSFLVSQLLDGDNEYNVVLKNINVFQSKESGNMFVKYFLNADSISKKLDEKRIKDLMEVAEIDQETAIAKLNKSVNEKKSTFNEFDWTLIEQISSVGPNKNGKTVVPIKTKKGTMFDPIDQAQKTLASLIVKSHNASHDDKWNVKTIQESLKQIIAENDIEGLKSLTNEIKNLDIFLVIRKGNPQISPDKQYGKIKAFDGLKK